jgi:hypothetical protein
MGKQSTNTAGTFEERLVKEAAAARQRAESMPPGIEREQQLRLAQQCETAVKINAWVSSPGLQPPE